MTTSSLVTEGLRAARVAKSQAAMAASLENRALERMEWLGMLGNEILDVETAKGEHGAFTDAFKSTLMDKQEAKLYNVNSLYDLAVHLMTLNRDLILMRMQKERKESAWETMYNALVTIPCDIKPNESMETLVQQMIPLGMMTEYNLLVEIALATPRISEGVVGPKNAEYWRTVINNVLRIENNSIWGGRMINWSSYDRLQEARDLILTFKLQHAQDRSKPKMDTVMAVWEAGLLLDWIGEEEEESILHMQKASEKETFEEVVEVLMCIKREREAPD